MTLKQNLATMQYQEESRILINDIESAYDAFGEPSSVGVLLVSGLGGQLISWDEDFCRTIAQHGSPERNSCPLRGWGMLFRRFISI